MLEHKYGLPSSDDQHDSAVGTNCQAHFSSPAICWLGRSRWDHNPQWYCPCTHARNRKGYFQVPPECCHWVKNGDEESTAAALEAWIHSSKGPRNGLLATTFSSRGDWKVGFLNFSKGKWTVEKLVISIGLTRKLLVHLRTKSRSHIVVLSTQ